MLTNSKIYGLILNVFCNKFNTFKKNSSTSFFLSKVLSKSRGINAEASQICYKYERASDKMLECNYDEYLIFVFT